MADGRVGFVVVAFHGGVASFGAHVERVVGRGLETFVRSLPKSLMVAVIYGTEEISRIV